MKAFFLLVCCIFVICITKTEAFCCAKSGWFSCCGVHSCNAFCCSCYEGCNDECQRKRIDASGVEESEAQVARATFDTIDADGNGLLTRNETIAYAASFSKVRVTRDTLEAANPHWFEDMDVNGDGAIQPEELDPSLHKN